MTQKHIDALRELSYQRGQLCPDCRRAWPVCDDDDAYRRPDKRRCSGKVAREVLAALTEDVNSDPIVLKTRFRDWVKCDGNHAAPICPDSECWRRDP